MSSNIGPKVTWVALLTFTAVLSLTAFVTPSVVESSSVNDTKISCGLIKFCDDGECRYPYRNYGDSVLDTPGVYWQAASVLMAIGCGMAILNAVTAVMALCAPYVVPSFVRTSARGLVGTQQHRRQCSV
eukprot:m.46602 g.46602  ORF g.46602 m.46602 type:complete len:129 (+) comp6783_c0_seq2:248-634(+)